MFQRTKLLGATLAASIGIVGFVRDAGALPTQATFTAAGLGAMGGWTLVGDAGNPELFGSGGNGFFASGGVAEFELRMADYGHQFGTALTTHGGRSAIFDTTVDSVGAIDTFSAPSNPFLFYFATLPCGGLLGCAFDDGRIYSDQFRDDDPFDQLDMAIYQQGGTFAFFFDDGGPAFSHPFDDDDYNDMVVTVRSVTVPEPTALSLLGAGLLALGGMARRRS
jgi:hypothetical protein